MPDQVVEVGEKVHVITRRLFDSDIRRHFVGEVTRVSAGLQEVCGYAFVFNPNTNEYKKRPELRTRLFRLGDAGLVVFKIPRDVVLESIEYRHQDKQLVVTDGLDFTLDINEFGSSR